ncbi:DUF4932 domain-containing protein [Fibrella aquatilis]|uniref:DUF4932 domain-containing protein n=1 Tax=Fibrella aquatilis TaxID=2817059 RepID=A0A939JXT9_9BACT|nr:DUF4932 domain-containing protein [Fibrella aquatilis]MBO0931374.1 DUF4932 domain-containing protein [Fibrella aquatilis]
MLFFLGHQSPASAPPKASSPVRLSETYELANIILALTDYGKTDRWEVAQQSAYYQQVRAYFAPYASHPLLTRVNYSREKWESYLSFRTDAYAFSFDTNSRLVRTIDFHANQGFNPFEEHLELIHDFVKTTGFRRFYRDHLPYYQDLATAYLQSQRYGEMRHFLEREFGERPEIATYAIVVSPLVGRMNCHRIVAGVGTDFISLPDFLLTGKAPHTVTQAEIASGTHMLFTELDHAFVNPLTYQHRALLRANFTVTKWDKGSGYDKDSVSTFNEYMTWAVYDLYVQTYFPAVAANVSQDWALQNATRGFFASSLVNQELTHLYNNRRRGQTIRDLYPALVKRLGIRQASLSQPAITDFSFDNQTVTDSITTVILHFSEPMTPCQSLDLIRVVEQGGSARQDRLVLTPETNKLVWTAQNTTLLFTLPLLNGAVNTLVFNYPWKTQITLRNSKGVDLPPYSRINIKVATN